MPSILQHKQKLLAGVATTIFLSACGDSPQTEFPNDETSVVLFLVDTLRADHLGCYGYERDTSPNLDALAAKGLRFEHCLSQSTWTRPSTASIHTGLYPSQHGVNVIGSIVHERFHTLAEVLQGNGFRTAAFGYNPHVFSERIGFNQGFERFQEMLSPGEVEDPDPLRMDHGARAPRIVDAALDWLDEIGGERSFLYVHLIDAHMPYQPPSPFDELFRDGVAIPEHDVWDLTNNYSSLSPEERQLVTDLYDGEIASLDQELGRFLRGLEERGRMENTLFLFVSDHGEELGDHGGFGHGNGQMYDEIVRVPFVMHVPGLAPEWRGQAVDSLVQQVDLLPTVVDVLGLPRPDGLPGISVLTSDLEPARIRGRVGISEVQGATSYRKALMLDDTKYIRTWLPGAGEEFFALGTDAQERHNLLEQSPGIANRHRELLQRHIVSSPGRYRFDVRNTGLEPIRVEGAMHTGSAPIVEGQLRDAEPNDGPYTVIPIDLDGVEVVAFQFTFQLEPGDHDGLIFSPPPDAHEIGLILYVDGEPAEPERVLVGTSEIPTAMPLALELANTKNYLAPPDVAHEWKDGPYQIRVWHMLDHAAPETEPATRDMEALRGLGYTGDE